MNKRRSAGTDTHNVDRKRAEDFLSLIYRIVHCSNRSAAIIDFLSEVMAMLADFSGCDELELRVRETDYYLRCKLANRARRSFRAERIPLAGSEEGEGTAGARTNTSLERFCEDVVCGRFDPSSTCFTKEGSFWTGAAEDLCAGEGRSRGDGGCKSLALVPIRDGRENLGLLVLKNKRGGTFTKEQIEFYERTAGILGVALCNARSRLALRERVKELTCLYQITQIAGRPRITMEEIIKETVELLPPAWLYPGIASGRIMLDARSYTTQRFREGDWKQVARLVVGGKPRGIVEVVYAEERSELDEGPFLKEERSLIDAVARQLALIIERREAEEDRSKLLDQLRHADRLATIGQLAAGVAHELNEPLGNILGFAQLAKKVPKIPRQAEQDMENIVTASLHAREIVRNLLFFARQMPTRMTRINLNEVIEQGLSLIESRCAEDGIELVRELLPELPEITVDPSQLHQVMINLAVNALQAMPDGGRLTVKTEVRDGLVLLIVEDTGVGMSDEVTEHIFDPFFTTKEVDRGTGLGLAVVHGIVTSHGGVIRVESEVGCGTRFEVKLPLEGPANEEKRK